jgi:predicted TIM-barrel fold metal-dependent hydrolase
MKTNLTCYLLLFLVLAGCRNQYYTADDYLLVPKIDSHVHLNTQRTAFADQALKDNFRLITLNVDHGDPADIQNQLTCAKSMVDKFPGKVFYGPTFYFDTAGWENDDWSEKVISQLKNSISAGTVSVKFWKNIGMVVRDRKGKFIMADNPKLDPVIDFIVKSKLPVAGHLGEPKDCWSPIDQMIVRGLKSYYTKNPQYHMFIHPEFPSYEDQITARDNMLEKHPDLKFIGCHLGSLEWSVDEIARRLDRFPNMVVDMSARIVNLQIQSAQDREKVRNFCIRYQDRLLYGTDLSDRGGGDAERLAQSTHNTWFRDWQYFATDNEIKTGQSEEPFQGLQLPKKVVRNIFSENAVKWYNLKTFSTVALQSTSQRQ